MNISLYQLLKAYSDNKQLIDEYMKQKENFNYTTFTPYTGGDMMMMRAVAAGTSENPVAGPVPTPSSDQPIHNIGPGGVQPRPLTVQDRKILGVAVGVFMVLLAVYLAVFIWALVLLVMHWSELECWAQVLCPLLLFALHIPFAPVIVILIIKFSVKPK
jgi:hypothetical protein